MEDVALNDIDIDTYFFDPASSSRNGLSKLSSELLSSRGRFVQRFVNPNDVVADISCGSGFLINYLQENRYIGVDHPSMIDRIKKKEEFRRNNLSFYPCDFEDKDSDLDLGEKVDKIISLETIEHLNNPERFLRMLHSNLRKGGSLVLSTPNNPYGLSPKYSYHFKEYSLTEMKKLLEETGFESTKEFVMGIPFGFIRYLLRKNGVNPDRNSPGEERGKLSKTMDHLPLIRRIYTTILPYEPFGNWGTNMIIIANTKT